MLVTVIDNTGEKDSTGGGVWGIKKDNCSAEISHDPYFEEGPFSLSTTGGIESRNIPVTTFYYTNASSESKTEVKEIAVTVTEPVIGETVDFSYNVTDGVTLGDEGSIRWYNNTDEGSIVKTFKITKADNPIKVTPVSKKVKLKTVRKKAVTVKGALKINKAKGKVSCKIQSAPKAIKKYLKINSKGVITINKWKAAKKGSYSVKVKVKAKGNNNYKSATKTVKAKIKIK